MRLGCYTTRGRYRPSDPANSTLEDLFHGPRSKNCPICIVPSERRLLCCERGLTETPVEGINLKESSRCRFAAGAATVNHLINLNVQMMTTSRGAGRPMGGEHEKSSNGGAWRVRVYRPLCGQAAGRSRRCGPGRVPQRRRGEVPAANGRC